MKFKVSCFSYYCLYFIYFIILIGWLILTIYYPVQNLSDFITSICYLLFFELIFFACSPYLQRNVIINDKYVVEKWLCFVINRIKISEISDIGLCVTCITSHIRQYIFISTKEVSNEQALELLDKKDKYFITIDYPQKGLDECMLHISKKNQLSYREIVD